jgi:hypothetical protein
MSLKIANAIKSINKNAEFSILENDVNQITWLNGTTPISVADINSKITELETAKANEEQAKIDLKASAKNKLMNGEALTEDEANVMVAL